ncbi:MAG: hypothetical protein STHCBS139747_008030 [Sporothrix thermara]
MPTIHCVVTAAAALWLATSALADSTSETACAPAPVAITIGNVTLSNNQIARGLDISIGSPPQSFAFLPQWPMNNSFVYGVDGHCTPDLSSAACTTFRGGAYSGIASITRTVPEPASHPVDAAPYSSVSFAADTVVLNGTLDSPSPANTTTTTSLAQFPFGVPLNDLGQQSYHPMNALGLGANSTLLNALKASGRIASRSWSMFWGLNGAEATAQMAGVFVLGGYDRAKTVPGQMTTLPLADAGSVCPSRMVLSITDLVLNFANGTDASLFPGAASTALQACITPDYPVLMTLPDDPFFKAMETLTNASIDQRSDGIVFFANRYLPGASSSSSVYTGDLTITLQSGLAIRVPNDQLIVPDRTIDPVSGAIVANSSGLDTTILAIQNINANDMTQLGRQFLSAAYVMLNQDAGSFTVWQANPTVARDLVAVDETNAELTACNASSSSSSSSSSSEAAESAAPSTKHVSPGVIAGAVVGSCIAVAALVGLAVFFCVRRRRQQRTAALAATRAVDAARHKFDPGRSGGSGAHGSVSGFESTTALAPAEAPADVPPIRLQQHQQVFHQLDAREIKYKYESDDGYLPTTTTTTTTTTPPPPMVEMEDSSRIELREWQGGPPQYTTIPRGDPRRQTPQYELQG